jgi:hypothetical protein
MKKSGHQHMTTPFYPHPLLAAHTTDIGELLVQVLKGSAGWILLEEFIFSSIKSTNETLTFPRRMCPAESGSKVGN